jgi:type VI secretion system secreted protein Hcp
MSYLEAWPQEHPNTGEGKKMPIYLQLPGVIGEADDEYHGHRGWIELETCSFGLSAKAKKDPSENAPGRTATIQEAYCTKAPDSTSVMLNRLSSAGKTQGATMIDYVNAQGAIYLQIFFKDVTVASHNFFSNVANGGPAVETFSLVFTESKTSFFKANDSGNELDSPIPAPF